MNTQTGETSGQAPQGDEPTTPAADAGAESPATPAVEASADGNGNAEVPSDAQAASGAAGSDVPGSDGVAATTEGDVIDAGAGEVHQPDHPARERDGVQEAAGSGDAGSVDGGGDPGGSDSASREEAPASGTHAEAEARTTEEALEIEAQGLQDEALADLPDADLTPAPAGLGGADDVVDAAGPVEVAEIERQIAQHDAQGQRPVRSPVDPLEAIVVPPDANAHYVKWLEGLVATYRGYAAELRATCRRAGHATSDLPYYPDYVSPPAG